jgi:hypothetical protein
MLYAIYKKQESHFYYLSYPFAGRTLERVWVLQCSPWVRWPAQLSAELGQGRAGEGC